MKNKLSPFDCDMCAMIENITKTPVEVDLSKENILLTVSVKGLEENRIKAIKEAAKPTHHPKYFAKKFGMTEYNFLFLSKSSRLKKSRQWKQTLENI